MEKFYYYLMNLKEYKNDKNIFDIDFKFWSIIPAINLNFYSYELQFEW